MKANNAFFKTHSRSGLSVLCLGIVLFLTACSHIVNQQSAAGGAGGDYMVVANHPNYIHVIDLVRVQVLRTCELPVPAVPGTIVMSPDKQIAYVLANRYKDVYGVDIDTCEVVFSTRQRQGNIRVITYGGIAVSPDGGEVYTHQNPTRLLTDRYEVMDTRVAVFRTDAGLDASPVRMFPAPRQITIMSTDASGTLYLAGPDIYAMDVRSGELSVTLASRSLEDPRYSQRDALSFWPIGTEYNEFIRLYAVAKYKDGSQDLGTANWFWGYERIDLITGEAESREFAPLKIALVSGMTRPANRNQMYAVSTQLKRFDIASMTEISSTDDLDHMYYFLKLSTDGSKVYLAGALNDIAVYDAETLEKQGNIILPGGDMVMTTAVIFRRPMVLPNVLKTIKRQ